MRQGSSQTVLVGGRQLFTGTGVVLCAPPPLSPRPRGKLAQGSCTSAAITQHACVMPAGTSLSVAGLGNDPSAATEAAGVCCARRQLMRIGMRRIAMMCGAAVIGCPIRTDFSLASAALVMPGVAGAGSRMPAEDGVARLSLGGGDSVSGDAGTASGVAASMMAGGSEPCIQQMGERASGRGLAAEGVGTFS